jgi:hypothetical protein
MVDMARAPLAPEAEAPILETTRYPYGLSISFDHEDLAKIDIEDDMELGDMIHFTAMAKVTHVTKQEVNGKPTCRVELQITDIMAIENENAEGPGEDADDD